MNLCFEFFYLCIFLGQEPQPPGLECEGNVTAAPSLICEATFESSKSIGSH